MNVPIILSRNAFGALLVCILGVSFSAQSQGASRFTALEIASLPQYCSDRLSNKRNMERWKRDFGNDNWIHLHHYCYALVYYARASAEIDTKRRRSATKAAIGQFDYVLARWPASFPLYQHAQIYKQQMEFLRELQ